jgi:hypothetical protein
VLFVNLIERDLVATNSYDGNPFSVGPTLPRQYELF